MFCATLFYGQNVSPAPQPFSSVAGIVIKQPSSEPLKKVLVQVVAENQKGGRNYTASTDAEGRFSVEGVEAGRYRIFFEKSGFVAINERGQKADTNVLTIKSGQSLDGLTFQMLPTAVISGRITDEDGDPMADVRVVAEIKRTGKIKRESVGTASTNDLGEYRLAGLFAGQYLIVAVPPPDFRDYEAGEKPQAATSAGAQPSPASAATPETRYLTTYYPGTFDVAQASVISLKSADDVPVNLTLAPARTYTIRGFVANMGAAEKPDVVLVSKFADSYRTNAAEIGPGGEFEIHGVAPGSYSLVATASSASQTLSARQDISVANGDVDGLRIAPSPSFTVSGHFRVEGGSNAGVGQFAVNLRPAEQPQESGFAMSQDLFGRNAAVDRQGNFEWKDVTVGSYSLQVFGGGAGNSFFVKSAHVGERDVEGGFTASGPMTVDLVVSYRGGTIEGLVQKEQVQEDDSSQERVKENDAGSGARGKRPASNATVVAVPVERYLKLANHFATGASDQNGRFTIRGLAPGKYTLYAWHDVEEGVYSDPDFLKSQEANGTPIVVEENSQQRVELNLSDVPTEWR